MVLGAQIKELKSMSPLRTRPYSTSYLSIKLEGQMSLCMNCHGIRLKMGYTAKKSYFAASTSSRISWSRYCFLLLQVGRKFRMFKQYFQESFLMDSWMPYSQVIACNSRDTLAVTYPTWLNMLSGTTLKSHISFPSTQFNTRKQFLLLPSSVTNISFPSNVGSKVGKLHPGTSCLVFRRRKTQFCNQMRGWLQALLDILRMSLRDESGSMSRQLRSVQPPRSEICGEIPQWIESRSAIF